MLIFLFSMIFMMPLFISNWFWDLCRCYFLIMGFFFIFFHKNFFFSNLGFKMGLDLLSWSLCMLSMWVCFLMVLSSESINFTNFYKRSFMLVIWCLLFLLILTFSTMNLFSFYMYFEGSLIPTLMLIIGWGYQPERLQAGIYMLFYTLSASMPLLLMIFYLYHKLGNLTYLFFSNLVFSNLYIYLGLYMAFLVKLPMFMVHLWLPKAHVEAPVSGSMILAGVLLKLGGYGIFRVFILVKNLSFFMNGSLILLSLVGGVLISIVCLRQDDMKSLIAYSSVSHMGLLLGGLLTYSYMGCYSALLMMISHGLCSSGLFFLSNVLYERVGSRSIIINRGVLNLMPTISMWWFFFCINNMGSPPSLNLVSEIGLINSLIFFNYKSMIMLMFLGFFSACYCLYLFSGIQHGKVSTGLYSFYMNNVREYYVLMMHWFPLNFLILNMYWFYMWV